MERFQAHPAWHVVRLMAFIAVFAWGWYILATFRTQQFGFSASMVGAAALFVLPLAWLPFIGLRWPIMLLGIALTLYLIVGAVETFALAEELRFRAKHAALPADAAMVVEPRQWPFGSHYLYYDPGSGQWGGGD